MNRKIGCLPLERIRGALRCAWAIRAGQLVQWHKRRDVLKGQRKIRSERRPERRLPARLAPTKFRAFWLLAIFSLAERASTADIHRDGEWFVAFCPEIPEANGQGRTQEECVQNLREAILLLLEDRREDSLKQRNEESDLLELA